MDIVERFLVEYKQLYRASNKEFADEIELIRKERDRYREALKKIVEPIGPSYPDSLIHNDLEIIEIAQAALKEGE